MLRCLLLCVRVCATFLLIGKVCCKKDVLKKTQRNIRCPSMPCGVIAVSPGAKLQNDMNQFVELCKKCWFV